MNAVCLSVALVGHVALWAAAFNRAHSTGVSPRLGRLFGFAPLAPVLAIPAAYFGQLGWAGLRPLDPGVELPWGWMLYGVLCGLGAIWVCALWGLRWMSRRPPGVLCDERARRLDLVAKAERTSRDGFGRHPLLWLPGNETLQLELVERAVALPGLPPSLDGLCIVHLSDLHLSGKVSLGYFQRVVQYANRWEPDLVAITGDLVERNRVLDWAPQLLGALEAKFGVYFTLGNHDAMIDHRRLCRALVHAGLVHLGGRSVELSIRGQCVILAGNELPWFPPAPQWPGTDGDGRGRRLRIALAHTPDQLEWARAHGVDLMLAGHLHGGQIRFPLIGPVLSPSRRGVRYACGLFDVAPTVLQVSRGVSAEYPIRINCPPEIIRLELRAPVAHPVAEGALEAPLLELAR
ncbi:MAG TPA: hypothetical protein EYP56_08345 [Planctomycetaceae bacterium]|nr:hypothetical protein [Planctomycetaceae bacterium]HIQ20380.1 hypothetical protein [Planctomycetota bacterium]